MSSNHCHGGSCSSEHSHHHHHEGHECCGSSSCSCCGHHHEECCGHHHYGKYTEELLNLADEAWMEVLKERIKEEIKSKGAQHIDALAKAVSEANHERWKSKMELKKNEEDFENKLSSINAQKQKS